MPAGMDEPPRGYESRDYGRGGGYYDRRAYERPPPRYDPYERRGYDDRAPYAGGYGGDRYVERGGDRYMDRDQRPYDRPPPRYDPYPAAPPPHRPRSPY
jgi:hypothetical protein